MSKGGGKYAVKLTDIVLDFVLSVVGELIPDTVHTHFELLRPEVHIKSAETGDIVQTVQSDVPDLLALDGMSILLLGKHGLPSC